MHNALDMGFDTQYKLIRSHAHHYMGYFRLNPQKIDVPPGDKKIKTGGL